MSSDHFTATLGALLFDLQQVSSKLGRLDRPAVPSDKAKYSALAIAAEASAIARDAAFIVSSLENSALGSDHFGSNETN